jgi:hypothetical protein
MQWLLVTVVLTTLYGCGSDGSITDSYVFPQGNATLAFSAISTARLGATIRFIDFTVTLPAGMEVSTTTGGSGPITGSTVTGGSALAGTGLAYGSYSASTRKAHLTMATTSDSYRAGEFLKLACTVAPNTSISLGALRLLNTPVPIMQAVGYDASSLSTVVLTNKLQVNIGVGN